MVFAAIRLLLDLDLDELPSIGVILAGRLHQPGFLPVRAGCLSIPEKRYRFSNRQCRPSPIPRKRSFFAGN